MDTKPSLQDWALAAIGVLFMLIGVVLLWHDLNTAVTTIAFAAALAAVGISTIARKRRYGRQKVADVQVVGGVRIRPSRLRLALFGGGVFGLGAVMLGFSSEAPFLILLCYWVIAGTGALMLVGLAVGYLPSQYIEFTPAGLVLGVRSWTVLLPWDQIERVSAGEMQRNPVLLLSLDAPETLDVTPPAKLEKFLKYIGQSRGWTGADIFLMTTHFGIDLPVLVSAISRYAADPAARAELAPPKALEG
ncbi:hypothetical protein [Rugamonas aquatica]|uniref:Uncharacterized protein n=1 Tax=Rugamonas aquatica TaxID=2743357 RepID=A0A6A7N973_9BURK|nr:hypothetical protein [Rugamonas aquatica]MQA41571.1 hypothetical protein [Rugamonas aquatica]